MRLGDFGQIYFNASFGSSFSSSIKMGERRIMRYLEDVHRLVRLWRRTKPMAEVRILKLRLAQISHLLVWSADIVNQG